MFPEINTEQSKAEKSRVKRQRIYRNDPASHIMNARDKEQIKGKESNI